MHTSKYSIQPPEYRTGTAGINRGVLVVLLCGLLCMIGAVTLVANAASSNLVPARPPQPATSNYVPPSTPTNASSPVSQTPTAPDQTSQIAVKPFNYPVFYGNTHLPEIALTFDDGPNPVYTPQILAILRAYHIQATFFDVGYLVKDFPDIVRQEFLQGNSIGNHSWSHPQLTNLSSAGIVSQLESTSNAIQAVTGVRPIVFRPPYGPFNREAIAQAFQQNLTTILWNNDARDWATPCTNVIVNRVLYSVHNGSIVLLHDGGGFRNQTVAALPISCGMPGGETSLGPRSRSTLCWATTVWMPPMPVPITHPMRSGS